MPMSSSMWKSFFKYVAVGQRWPLVVSLLIFLVLAGTLSGWLNIQGLQALWSGNLEPLINLATFLVAVLVWWGEANQDWRLSLPCKLTTVFLFNDQEIMRCERADLTSEADMRALGQHLGRQMNEGENLQLELPTLKRTGGMPEEGADGEIYRHYTIRFKLLELPQVAKLLSEGEALLWSYDPVLRRWSISSRSVVSR